MDIQISNLSDNVIESDLQKLFAVYGDVAHVAVIRDQKSGQSKGRAFLVMPHAAQGEQAVLALSLLLLDGRRISAQAIAYKAGECNH